MLFSILQCTIITSYFDIKCSGVVLLLYNLCSQMLVFRVPVDKEEQFLFLDWLQPFDFDSVKLSLYYFVYERKNIMELLAGNMVFFYTLFPCLVFRS